MADSNDDSPSTAPGSPSSLPFDAPPGSRVGRYVVIGPAGQGGMGVVLLAYDPELDRRVALKLLRMSRLGADRERRLVREAQALARLSHPNVVPVYDVGTFEGRPFVAMEYVEGETLGAWLEGAPRGWREILAVLREAGRGLAAAHRAGLVHRDVKPGNVLIGRDGRVRVVDFGLARSVEDSSNPTPHELPHTADALSDSGSHRQLTQLTRDDQIVGTPAYMAPEQEAHGSFDARADQYSFGVTLFRALYGRLPHDDTATLESPTVDERGGAGRRRAQVARGRDVPAWLHKVVRRALAADPAARYPSMDALLAALDRDPAQARRRWAAGLALLAAGAAATFGVTRWQRAERNLCSGGHARVAAVWSSEAAEKLRAAFARSGLAWAPAQADSLVRQLDDWSARWAAMHRDACEATHLRGEQSPEAMDLRMSCLDDRLRELSAVTRALAGADAATVRRASDVTQSLTPLDSCADLAALHAVAPRPKDAQRGRVDALGQRVAEVEARYLVGRAKECVSLGEPLVGDVHAVGYAPLEADAEQWLARCYSDLHDQTRATAHFVASFAAALAGRSDHVAAHVAARLAQEHLFDNAPAHLQAYDEWRQIAQSAARRAGGDTGAELILARVRCISLFDTGQIVDRVQCMSDVVRRADEAQRVTEWDVSMLGLASVDAGRFDDGVRHLERGVRLSVEQLGDKHPRTLENRSFLCYAYDERGDAARADEVCATTLRDAQQAGADRYLITRLQLYAAQAQRHLGRLADARATAERALAAHEDDFVPDLELELGWLDVAEGHAADAVAHMRRALALDAKSLPPEHANVLRDRQALGTALLAAGDAAAARETLEPAVAAKEKTQLSPLASADLDFALARALPPTERARATALVARAVAAYRTHAPTLPRHQEALAQMLTWR